MGQISEYGDKGYFNPGCESSSDEESSNVEITNFWDKIDHGLTLQDVQNLKDKFSTLFRSAMEYQDFREVDNILKHLAVTIQLVDQKSESTGKEVLGKSARLIEKMTASHTSKAFKNQSLIHQLSQELLQVQADCHEILNFNARLADATKKIWQYQI